jgi:hypothetical protein
VAVSRDTTDFDFSHMKEIEGLGTLNEETRRGFYMHSLYAISEQGLPLGLLDAAVMLRDDGTFRSAATRKQRAIEEKESFRWVEGYLKTLELARRLPECEVFSISDREGDTHRSARTVHQVVRAMKITPRPPGRKGGKLEEVAFWAVLAEETDPPAGEEPFRWLLLPSKEVCPAGRHASHRVYQVPPPRRCIAP